MRLHTEDRGTGSGMLLGAIALVLIALTLFGGVWGWKSVKVWAAGQDGRAILAEAEYSRQVQLEEAKANLESERLNAEAEVVRATGAAAAIEIEGGTLTENYILYLWVRNLEKLGDNVVIYIPTEGGLPILEASRSTGGSGG